MMSAADLSAIHAAFSEVVGWSHDGAASVDVRAIVFHGYGNFAFSQGNSVRQRGYEVPKALLPFEPKNGDIITEGDVAWRVIEVIDYDEAAAWRAMVEKQ